LITDFRTEASSKEFSLNILETKRLRGVRGDLIRVLKINIIKLVRILKALNSGIVTL